MQNEIEHNGSTTGKFLVDAKGKLTAQPNDGFVARVLVAFKAIVVYFIKKQ